MGRQAQRSGKEIALGSQGLVRMQLIVSLFSPGTPTIFHKCYSLKCLTSSADCQEKKKKKTTEPLLPHSSPVYAHRLKIPGALEGTLYSREPDVGPWTLRQREQPRAESAEPAAPSDWGRAPLLRGALLQKAEREVPWSLEGLGRKCCKRPVDSYLERSSIKVWVTGLVAEKPDEIKSRKFCSYQHVEQALLFPLQPPLHD